jgi:hypothetical protein
MMRGLGDRVGVEVDRLGVRGRELPAAVRAARLEQRGRALRRWLGDRHAVHAEPLALVLDGPDLVGVHVDAALVRAHDRVVVPCRVPQGVGHVEELVAAVVAHVVGQLFGQPVVDRGAADVGRHDVPADPPVGEVIERRELACQRHWVVVGDRGRDHEPEPLGDGRQHGDQIGGVEPREPAGTQRVRSGLRRVGADRRRVGEEDRVEARPFERPREVLPVPDVLEELRSVVGVAPEPAVRRRPGALDERQPDVLGHAVTAWASARPGWSARSPGPSSPSFSRSVPPA